MKTAKFVRDLDGFTGEARFYELSEPLDSHRFVIVSAITVLGTPETYIFGANPDGSIKGWLELDGSYKGGLDHNKALNGAGYEVTK